MSWDENSSAYIAEGSRMRSMHAGIRAVEGGDLRFFSHRYVCVSPRTCVRQRAGRGCRYFVSFVTSRGRRGAKGKGIRLELKASSGRLRRD